MNLISPLTLKNKSILIGTIETARIVSAYFERYNIEVKQFFYGINQLEIWECTKSGYRFFYPFTTQGNSMFYEQLQKFDWYYMPWKWEHCIAEKYIQPQNKLLEIGCGSGEFINRLIDKKIDCIGLELNPKKINSKISDYIIIETIEQHSITHQNLYDVVCSFQVLEHVAEVKSFIDAAVTCLKPKGYLIFSVPNNGSFLKYDLENSFLNMPPHHLGLWSSKSLKYISKQWNLKLEKIYFEPLQTYHMDWYFEVKQHQITRYNLLKRIYYRFHFDIILKKYIQKYQSKIKGHTILVIYSK